MKILDADATILADHEGKEAVRDIVQFVQYEDFEEIGIRELASAVLGEVPDQFVEYMVMAKDLNNAGKDLYKGKKTLHELISGSKKSEKLDEWKIVKSKTMMNSNPMSRERNSNMLDQDEIEIDRGGHASIVNLAQTLEVHAAMNRLDDKSGNSISNVDVGVHSHSRAAAE